MAVINEIYEFGGSGTVLNGDVMSTAGYLSDAQRLVGHQTGIARRDLENTALRNLSRFCRGVAQFIAERYAPGVVDDGDADKIVAGMESAVNGLIGLHNVSATAHADIRALIAALGADRYETMWLGAGAMIPSKTNGAVASTPEGTNYKLVSDVLDFASSADQSAQAVFQLPRNWDRGPIKAQVHWRPGAAGATAGQYVGWMLSGGAVGDGDVVDRALGAGVTVADQVLAGLDTVEHVSAASAEITLGGNPALGDRLHLQITRDADYAGGGTAMPVVARLLGLEIQYRVTGTAEAWS